MTKQPVRVFIATSPGTDDLDAEIVLEYTLKKNCSRDIEVVFMRNNTEEGNFFGFHDDIKWTTPFTNLRWTIPEYCNFKGRAIYMDVDIFNLRDIAEFFDQDMKGNPLLIRKGANMPRSCIMLMDCEKLRPYMDPIDYIRTHSHFPYIDRIMHTLEKVAGEYDPRWNVLDDEGKEISDMWNLHFTSMKTQPWKPQWGIDYHERNGIKFTHKDHARPDVVALWKSLLIEAKAANSS